MVWRLCALKGSQVRDDDGHGGSLSLGKYSKKYRFVNHVSQVVTYLYSFSLDSGLHILVFSSARCSLLKSATISKCGSVAHTIPHGH